MNRPILVASTAMPPLAQDRSPDTPAIRPARSALCAAALLTGLAAGSAAAGPLGPLTPPATLLAAYSPTQVLDTAFDSEAPASKGSASARPKPPWSVEAGQIAGLSLAHRRPRRSGLSAVMSAGRLRLSALTCTGAGRRHPLASCSTDLGGTQPDIAPRPRHRATFSTIGITLRF
jgi:hypothetical protein